MLATGLGSVVPRVVLAAPGHVKVELFLGGLSSWLHGHQLGTTWSCPLLAVILNAQPLRFLGGKEK